MSGFGRVGPGSRGCPRHREYPKEGMYPRLACVHCAQMYRALPLDAVTPPASCLQIYLECPVYLTCLWAHSALARGFGCVVRSRSTDDPMMKVAVLNRNSRLRRRCLSKIRYIGMAQGMRGRVWDLSHEEALFAGGLSVGQSWVTSGTGHPILCTLQNKFVDYSNKLQNPNGVREWRCAQRSKD